MVIARRPEEQVRAALPHLSPCQVTKLASAVEPTYRLAAQAYATLAPLPLPLEILFMTRAEFDARGPAVASLPATVLREGRLLYAA